ncbi:MAG: hypothetical protein H0U64_10940 [Gemmatimonadaceae bacterium]|nr:hypothetical protein [Gemmatimonadaceae bacterium]
MVSSRRTGTIATLLISLFLAVEGVWGLAHPPAYGFLPTNTLRACIHLVFGLIGLAVLRTGQVGGYLKVVGSIVLLVGAGWFLPVAGDLIRSLLAVDRNGALIDVGLGLLALLSSRAEKHTGPREPRDRTIPV